MELTNNDLLRGAIAEAKAGLSEGGIPIGAVMVDPGGNIVSRGHNLRVQTGDPTAHAEVVCIRNAGRRTDLQKPIFVSTLCPFIICTGSRLLYKISQIIHFVNNNFIESEEHL